ncbi:unnamed protein product, partial [Callosobruchus maculatus]
MSKFRGQRSEVKVQRSKVRGQRSEVKVAHVGQGCSVIDPPRTYIL